MAKYSFKFKIAVVKEYLDGQGGYKYLEKKYSVYLSIEKWATQPF